MKSNLIYFFFILILAGCGYKKEKPGPLVKKPSPSSDGRNTFYCEINGVPYYQKFTGGHSSFPKIDGSYSFLQNGHALGLTIKYQDNTNNLILSFAGENIREGQKIELGQIPNLTYFYFVNISSGCNFSDSILPFKTYSGYIRFSRFDPKKSIYSGTFEFKNWFPGSEKGNCDTVKVTNGIFDVKI